MSDLFKTERETIRFTKEQARRLALAAKIESRRKGELVETGPLLRDLGMPLVTAIVAGATKAELKAAEEELAAEEAAAR